MSHEKIEELTTEILVSEISNKRIEDEMAEEGGIKWRKEIIKIEEHLNAAREEYQNFQTPYAEKIQENQQFIEDAKEIILEEMLKEPDKKTINLDIAKVQMKTTKSVKVLDKVALVDALDGIKGGIENGIKTFALPYIRKLMEVEDAIPENIATFEEKRKVHITKKQEEK